MVRSAGEYRESDRMARYFVTIVGSIMIPVDADSEEQARDIADEYAQCDNDNFVEVITHMNYFVSDCEEVDPDEYDCSTMGLSAKKPDYLHDLDEEE